MSLLKILNSGNKVTIAYGDFRPLMTVLEIKDHTLKVWYLNFRLVKPKYVTTEILLEDLDFT